MWGYNGETFMTTTMRDLTFSPVLYQVVEGSIARTANGFLVDARSRGLSHHTLRDYSNELTALLKWLDLQGVVMLDELKADTIRKYLLSLQSHRNPGGQFAAFRVIRTCLFWWERETDDDYHAPIRKVKPPKVNHQPLPGISEVDILALIDSCRGANKGRDQAILLFLYDTGVRASELVNINLADIDLTTGSIIIRNGKGGKRRVVYCGQKTRRDLKKYLHSRTRLDDLSPLFTTFEEQRLTYAGLRQIIRRRSKDANLPTPGLHDFRRAFAVNMLRNGCDLISLSRLMGHSSLTVLKRYIAQTDEDLMVAHHKASPVEMLKTHQK